LEFVVSDFINRPDVDYTNLQVLPSPIIDFLLAFPEKQAQSGKKEKVEDQLCLVCKMCSILQEKHSSDCDYPFVKVLLYIMPTLRQHGLLGDCCRAKLADLFQRAKNDQSLKVQTKLLSSSLDVTFGDGWKEKN
jgi:hypothetical protein